MSTTPALSTSGALPRGAVLSGRPLRGFPALWHFATEYLLLLPCGVAVALVWANTYPEGYFRTVFALDFFVTRVAMVFFFGLIVKEVVEATAPGGVLHSWRRLGVPVVAAVGTAAVPALVLTVSAPALGEAFIARGWAVTFATDLAVAYFVAIVIFGRHPAVPFLLLLALSANVFGFLALAPAAIDPQVQSLALVPLMVSAVAAAAVLRWSGVARVWPYVVIGGGLSWLALFAGGVHPALALLPIVPFMPRAPRDPGFFVEASPDAPDTLNVFERWCRHPAQIALLLFGFVTGGVQLQALDLGTWSVPLAFFVGKPLGLLAGMSVALALGFRLPPHLGWRDLVVVGCVSSLGFTMALFFATVAVGPGPVLSALKMGALVTVVGAPLAFAAAWLLGVGRFADRASHQMWETASRDSGA